ncbi:MAG: nucleotide modification associated domain-containing protein [Brevinematia bacterium]
MLDKNILNSIVSNIVDLLIQKNADYGDSYFKLRDDFGKISFIVRLVDKTERLKNLAKKESYFFSESEEDTIKDIIGYCLLELYYRYHYNSSNK